MTTYTTAQKINGLNNMNAAAQRVQLGDIVYGALNGGYPGGGFEGNVYFVDKDFGSATGDGLSWDTAFNDINLAVTASEAHRLALTNVYTRHRIYIAGASADYAKVTALPNYTDIIGVGADPRGNGTGIVVISGGGAYDAVAGTQRGNNWYNIQFEVDTDTYWAFDTVQTLRTVFENCAFMCATGSGMSAGGGFRATGNCGGITFKNCHFGTNGAGQLKYGIYLSSLTFNNCWIVDSHITAITAGIYLTGCNCTNTRIGPNNIIGGGTSTQVVTGIAAGGHELIAGNFITASTDAISGATAVNTIGNEVIDNVTAAREKA